METMNDNQLNSLKRLKDISRIIEATLQQNNRIKGILASELYFRKKCEASIETIKNNTDEQECYRKVSKIFIRKPKSVLAKELDEELAEYDKYNPHLVDLRKKLVDKLSNLKEQYLQAQEAIEKEASQAN
ncbi:conserved Plasmodium protein, unknown function [Plasmodium vinckei brucechwatti]|uniref:Mediator of RNA polymerase II transcription subunit 11 n=1 Tax=Plasmodium vinckei brucechwatti TaxID=119398 RepID=A0A6V7S9P9_PLAVN|nr:conserved Plasmodium protein, unknown function [Plasmodium vinckei brucechwatti]